MKQHHSGRSQVRGQVDSRGIKSSIKSTHQSINQFDKVRLGRAEDAACPAKLPAVQRCHVSGTSGIHSAAYNKDRIQDNLIALGQWQWQWRFSPLLSFSPVSSLSFSPSLSLTHTHTHYRLTHTHTRTHILYTFTPSSSSHHRGEAADHVLLDTISNTSIINDGGGGGDDDKTNINTNNTNNTNSIKEDGDKLVPVKKKAVSWPCGLHLLLYSLSSCALSLRTVVHIVCAVEVLVRD